MLICLAVADIEGGSSEVTMDLNTLNNFELLVQTVPVIAIVETDVSTLREEKRREREYRLRVPTAIAGD